MAGGTTTPIGHLGLVDLEAIDIRCFETRSIAHCAIDVDDVTAFATDEVVMVVSDAVLVQSGRANRLNSTDQTFVDQKAEGVIHRLAGDCSDVGLRCLGDVFGRAVGLVGHRSENGEPLRGDVESVALQGF